MIDDFVILIVAAFAIFYTALKLPLSNSGSSLQVTFLKWLRSYKYLESQFAKSRLHFVFDDHLGYLTANPASLGTAMTIAVGMRLPALHR